MPGPSFDEILQEAKQQIALLQERETNINDEIRAIRNKNPGQPLSNEDRALLKGLRDELDLVLAAIDQTALLALINLDKTAEISNIADSLQSIARDLQAKADSLTALGVDAKAAGERIAGLDTLAKKLKSAIGKG